MNLYEMLEYGPIVAQNEEYNLLVSIGNECLILWKRRSKDKFEDIGNNFFSVDVVFNGPHEQTLGFIMKEAEKYLEESIAKGLHLNNECGAV